MMEFLDTILFTKYKMIFLGKDNLWGQFEEAKKYLVDTDPYGRQINDDQFDLE